MDTQFDLKVNVSLSGLLKVSVSLSGLCARAKVPKVLRQKRQEQVSCPSQKHQVKTKHRNRFVP